MTAIIGIIGWLLNSKLGQYALGAVGIVALVVGFSLHEQNKGAVKEQVRVEAKGKKIAKKADAAAAAAERNSRRVLLDWQRD